MLQCSFLTSEMGRGQRAESMGEIPVLGALRLVRGAVLLKEMSPLGQRMSARKATAGEMCVGLHIVPGAGREGRCSRWLIHPSPLLEGTEKCCLGKGQACSPVPPVWCWAVVCVGFSFSSCLGASPRAGWVGGIQLQANPLWDCLY